MTGPKNEHKANRWLLSILAVCSMLGVVFSIAGITLAAYLNALQVKNQVKVDFDDLSKYFYQVAENEAGNPEAGHTYVIQSKSGLSASEQFINLQKIVTLGLLKTNDIVTLNEDVSWDQNLILSPIGSDDMPFDSTFNGAGHTISNLLVAGLDGRDVGMFGYTSINSEVKNLILDHPTITVSPNSSEDGNGIYGGPIDRYFQSAAEGLPDISFTQQSGSIFIDNDSGNTGIISGFSTSFTDVNGASHQIEYETSDPNTIELTIDSSGAVTGHCKVNEESLAKDFDLFPCTITAKVRYAIDDQFGYYVMERYQFNVLGNGKVSTSTVELTEGDPNSAVSSGAFKTIHPEYDDHKLNVGFFIGHCDGKANHLGLYGGNGNNSGQNGTIVIQGNSRPSAYSARVLIGKTRKDNPVDASAGDIMSINYNYRSAINGDHDYSDLKVRDYQYGYENPGQGYGGNYTYSSTGGWFPTYSGDVVDFYGSDENGDYGTEKDSAAQNNNAAELTNAIIPAPMQEYSKFFPGSNTSTAADSNGYKPVTSNWESNITYEDDADTEEANDGGMFNAQVLDGGLGAGTVNRPTSLTALFGIITSYYRVTRAININNGFWVWSTKDLSPIFGQNLFYINFHISYVATRDEGVDPNQNSFQLLFNAYNPEVEGSAIKFGDWEISSGWNSSHTKMLFWQDLSHPYAPDNSEIASLNSIYNPADHPVIDDGQLHSDVITLEIDQQNGGWFQTISNMFGADYEVRYPTFAFGYGSNIDVNGNVYSASNHQSTMRYYADYYYVNNSRVTLYNNDHFIDWKNDALNNSTYLDEATFGIVGTGYQDYTAPNNQSEENGHNNYERGYFNSYFEVAGGTKIYIKDFQVSFTNRLGNTEDIIYNVDYVTNGTDADTAYGWDNETQAWNAWPDNSNVLVNFDFDDLNQAGDLTFRFYRNNDTVYGYYSNGNYPLANTDTVGYGQATLVQG